MQQVSALFITAYNEHNIYQQPVGFSPWLEQPCSINESQYKYLLSRLSLPVPSGHNSLHDLPCLPLLAFHLRFIEAFHTKPPSLCSVLSAVKVLRASGTPPRRSEYAGSESLMRISLEMTARFASLYLLRWVMQISTHRNTRLVTTVSFRVLQPVYRSRLHLVL